MRLDDAVGGMHGRLLWFLACWRVHRRFGGGVRSRASSFARRLVDGFAGGPVVRQIADQTVADDPFRRGVSIVLGRTRADLCPVKALLAYLARRRFAPGPLFLFENGEALSRAALVDQVRRALTTAGIDATRFAGHSFRIGAVTTAAARGLYESIIQTLGRWKSAAFMRYIRLDEQQLARYSRELAE